MTVASARTVQFMGHGGSGGTAQWLDCGARTISGYRCWGGGMVDRIALACADLRSHTDTRFWAGDGDAFRARSPGGGECGRFWKRLTWREKPVSGQNAQPGGSNIRTSSSW